MSPVEPLNNQDNLSRTQSGAEVRGSEVAKELADARGAAVEQRKAEEQKEVQVNSSEGQEGVDPDEEKRRKKDEEAARKKAESEKEQQGKHFMGGSFFDATA